MSQIRVVVVSPEEAYDGTAEFWCDGELMGITTLSDDGLQLQIDARVNGGPWIVETASLAQGLSEAARLLAAY